MYSAEQKEILKRTANIIRGLSMDGVQAANSGHPGLPMGMADVATVLWSDFLKFNPENPGWFNRDRFVLSGGHGSMLLYSLLHLYGFDLPLEELKNFRQWGSKTAGHPEFHETPGVETTTGPLGQGLGNAVGMALAESSLAARFNSDAHNLVDHYTYVFAGDGDLQEGVSHEACAFAGHNKLGKLILLYDDNGITIDGSTDLSFSEDVLKRYEAYDWHTQRIDGHDVNAIHAAIESARMVPDKPSIIACKTIIGFGSPNRGGTSKAHGEPLGAGEVALSKTSLGLSPEQFFYVSEEVADFTRGIGKKGAKLESDWNGLRSAWEAANTDKKTAFNACLSLEVSEEALNIPEFEAGSSMATRAASGKILDHLAPRIPALIGGSADLTPSNKTDPKGETSYSPQNRTGRYIHYGVREHGMGAIMNGMQLHGGVINYGATFFVFTDYMRPPMRLAALMGIPVIYVMTHDSIGLGEDGPTHQPIEHLSSLRVMPNMSVIRPMDANETAEAWKMALLRKDGPTTLVLTRQNLKTIDRSSGQYASVDNTRKGGYVLTEDAGFDSIIISAGSEVEIALSAKEKLNAEGKKVRIVSMPSTDVFDAQSEAYKASVLPVSVTNRVAIEAGARMSWYKYVGTAGKVIGLDHFGASAPYEILYEKFGITAEAVVAEVKKG
ncbi:MAG: transketolase [Saprospiraceae bacterium]|nr:transketolase [Saprospiraceae bacterium]MCB9326095.1 transketolase [Lewinellaceae bacterium]